MKMAAKKVIKKIRRTRRQQIVNTWIVHLRLVAVFVFLLFLTIILYSLLGMGDIDSRAYYIFSIFLRLWECLALHSMLRIAEGSELSKWFSLQGWIRLCHKAEDKVIKLKSTSLTKNSGKKKNNKQEKEKKGTQDGVTGGMVDGGADDTSRRTGSSNKDEASGKFSNIFVRQSSSSSNMSSSDRTTPYSSETTTATLDAVDAAVAIEMSSTSTAGQGVDNHYVNPMTQRREGSEEARKEERKDEIERKEGKEGEYEGVWSSHIDDASGEMYYHRSLDGRTTWTSPWDVANKIDNTKFATPLSSPVATTKMKSATMFVPSSTARSELPASSSKSDLGLSTSSTIV